MFQNTLSPHLYLKDYPTHEGVNSRKAPVEAHLLTS